MSLTVEVCSNRKTWDARVRVTGGHPELLWGIGESEAVTDPEVSVHRVMVHRDNQTVGYGQLLVRPEDLSTVVDAKSLHVKSPKELLPVLEALQRYSRDQHQAAVLRVSPDTHVSPELVTDLEEAGYRRRDPLRKGQAGPRHMVIRLGETQKELSRRLSQATLDRCRAGLRATGITVRRVSASTQSLADVGLRTAHIEALLHAVGEDSVFLVATEQVADGGESALGYLWFVHTGESAMLYRLGFTDRARSLGVDDALLLTGLVQLQQRRVHKVIAGDPDDDTQSAVLRELAKEFVPILGTWEYPLIGEFQIAGRAEKTRRKIFGRPDDSVQDTTVLDGPHPHDVTDEDTATGEPLSTGKAKRRFWARKPKSMLRPSPGQQVEQSQPEPQSQDIAATAGEAWAVEGTSADAEMPGAESSTAPAPAPAPAPASDGPSQVSENPGPGSEHPGHGSEVSSQEEQPQQHQGRVRSFMSRAVNEASAAIRDAARW